MPPSGPMDALAFRLANALVGNGEDAAGLEFAIAGPTLRFHSPTTVRVQPCPCSYPSCQSRLKTLEVAITRPTLRFHSPTTVCGLGHLLGEGWANPAMNPTPNLRVAGPTLRFSSPTAVRVADLPTGYG